MELLLNLAWLLLAIPAYRLWRKSTPANRRDGRTSMQCLLALGCILVLLFPVISATDDLHAMRAEMEESPASKRSVLQASSEKNAIPHIGLQNPPALSARVAEIFISVEFAGLSGLDVTFVAASPSLSSAGRAPPTRSRA